MAENVGADLPPTLLVTHFDRQIDTLRGTLKWLIASGGAVVAAIVAGAQLTDFSNRSIAGNILAGVPIAVGLILAFALLIATAKILTIARPTFTDIDDAEKEVDGANEQKRALAQINDPLMKWIYDRGSDILGPYPSVEQLFNQFSHLTVAAQATPTEEQKSQLSEVRRRIDLLESAAHFRTVDLAYTALMTRFRIGCAIFIVAVIAYALSGLATKDEIPQVTSPTPVRVITPKADPSDTCADRIGVAIAGDIDSPTVMLPPAGKCPAQKLDSPDREGVIVIPLVPTPAPPKA
ncbi:hypothetical protein [Mycolicibacterium houstonense]|uniref:hypothetical protein n=1 Tax=Mycolicibacterium houstonense TaxID=146021 RepID=UPI003F96272F